MLPRRDPPQTMDTYRLKMKGWKKIFHANGDQKKAGVTLPISNKIYLEIMAMKKVKERTLHNDQRVNPRRHNNYKYMFTQYRSIPIHKANANKYERGN